MSGFIAIVNTDGSPVDRGLLARLTDSLRHCGPDRHKMWIDDHVGFGHTLFKTTDEAEYEHQPDSLEGDVWITGSARIDARADLIAKLGLQSKIRLDHTPDSHLILHAYRAWGDKCSEHLLGDFAFVIWDKKKKKLFCARDSFGMRQLYYAHRGNCFIISNSLHCMLQHPSVSKRLDDRAIGGFLLFGDHTWLDKTLTAYEDIKSLLPAHGLVLKDGKTTIRKYWDIPTDIPLLRYRKENDYIDHFQEVFKKAVNDRLRTNRVVLSMSGGMDSSAIAATLCEIRDEENRDFGLNAVTVIYNKVHPCQEHYFADLVARHLGLSIQYINGDLYPFLSQSIPSTRPVAIEQPSLWLDIIRKQRMLGRVVLTGNAADNLLSYPPSLTALKGMSPWRLLSNLIRLRRQYGEMPGFGMGLQKILKGGWFKHGAHPAAPYPYPTWITAEFEKKMHLKEWWTEYWTIKEHASTFSSRRSLLAESLLKPDWCVADILTHSDFTLPEQRDPYLDQRMVKFVLSLPPLPWLFKKDILRQAMQKKLPAEIISRPKTPLGTLHHSLLQLPDIQWIIDEWQPLPELKQYVERSKIPKLVEGAREPRSSSVNLRPLILNKWLQHATE
ncbi:MAG: asparagine synthase-related protein [Desulfobulbaceae bacterium]|jgi:asparagine synthase (glutamine-hydrolysing)|nr:asparagine synthase-related protein [Desulfobulbaceae bacterium]